LSSPFDEQKYKGLLEGLEVSEVWLTLFFKENVDFRLDAEYVSKRNIELNSTLDKVGFKRIGEFADVTDGIHASIDYSEESDVKLVSATSPRENYFDFSRNVFISKESHLRNPRTALKVGDVIISTVGTIGNSAVVTASDLPANSDRHVGIIRIINTQFLPNYVSTFLLSKYGRFQTLRESTENVQLNLFIYKIKTLKIANLSIYFQKKIDEMVCLANNNREQSQILYRQAEELLLETLGLKDFQPSQTGTNIKSFKESFLATGRLDAEYYQPKYEDYVRLIRNYPGGFELLQAACNLKDSNFTPDETKEYQYIELSDIGKSGNITGCMFAQGKELPSRARRKINANDVVISSIEGSLESCAFVTEDYDNALCSTGFYVISSDKINSETLLVLFKSEVMQNILKQNCSGTILTAINKTEFQNIPVPLIGKDIQQQIAELIRESFVLRRESERLLEEAKEMVEKEIEKSK
jgi:restriction endonuclease S subunit